MRISTKYICDLCGTEYDTEAQALHCEATHTQPVVFDDKQWMFGKKYPDKLTIEMDDGAVCQYSFLREMRGATT